MCGLSTWGSHCGPFKPQHSDGISAVDFDFLSFWVLLAVWWQLDVTTITVSSGSPLQLLGTRGFSARYERDPIIPTQELLWKAGLYLQMEEAVLTGTPHFYGNDVWFGIQSLDL